MFKFYDDFLEKEYFDRLVEQINSRDFPWKYCDTVSHSVDDATISKQESEEQFYFVHNINVNTNKNTPTIARK